MEQRYFHFLFSLLSWVHSSFVVKNGLINIPPYFLAVLYLNCHYEIFNPISSHVFLTLQKWITPCSSEHFIHQLSRYEALEHNPLISEFTLVSVWQSNTNTNVHTCMYAPTHTLISCAIFMTQSYQSLLWLLKPPPSWLHPDELYILSTSYSFPINKNIGSLLPPDSNPETLSSSLPFPCINAVRVSLYQYVVESVRTSRVLEQESIILPRGKLCSREQGLGSFKVNSL